MISFWNFQLHYVIFYPVIMSIVWIIGALVFYYRWERRPRLPLESHPRFSIIIAAHNEESTINSVVDNLSRVNYPSFEVVLVNDGSTDNTGRLIDGLSERYPGWCRAVHLAPNSGKSKAINTGVLFSKGELILVMDADCFLHRNALRMMAWHFEKFPRTGAVTGNPRIINRTCLLGKIQVGEYSSIIGLIKRSQRILGKVLTVSGVIAAYRRDAFFDCRFFDSDTATEDIDITWKLQKLRWEVRYEPRALCYILSPETINGLWRQRVRWARGGIGVVVKHFDVWLDWKNRRFWPVYVDYLAGMAWALCLGNVVLFLGISHFLHLMGITARPFLLPAWSGPLLAALCMLQFMVSMYIDYRYERKTFLKYYFWIIWYPFFYWGISALSVYGAMYDIFRRRGGTLSIWKSPDRGLHTLKS